MPIDRTSDGFFMGEALQLARRAFDADEVPVGAVIVRECEGAPPKIIARAYNQVEQLKDATAHAEMIAITQAATAVGDWRLSNCTLFVTKEPCPMCAGAILLARVKRLVFGCADPRAGGAGSKFAIAQSPVLHHKVRVESGPRAEESSVLLKEFFRKQRGKMPRLQRQRA